VASLVAVDKLGRGTRESGGWTAVGHAENQ